MGLGTSLFLIAVGAVLAYAVEVETEGFNLDAIGIILILVGVIGALLSLVYWNSWGGFRRDTTVVRDRPVATRRRVYEDDVY